MTRLYFHNPTSTLSNLPTTNQSTLTPTSGKQIDAFTVNRTMDRTKGVDDLGVQILLNTGSSQQNLYWSRFVSEPLEMYVISSDTWTYNFAAWEGQSGCNFPCTGSNQSIYILFYVWRPTAGKVGTILEGNSNADFEEPNAAATVKAVSGTFSGGSVTCQPGDVLIFEVWFKIIQSNLSSQNVQYRYDGVNITTVDQTTVTDHATFLETTQGLSFVGDFITVSSDTKDIIRPMTLERI